MSNLDKYKSDLDKLISEGSNLFFTIQYESYPTEFETQVKPKLSKKEYEALIKTFTPFKERYQNWYSQSLVLLKQLLPDRLPNFIKLYEKPANRKEIKYGNYVIEDYLQRLTVTTSFGERKVGPEAAVSQFEQQLYIVKSIKERFESSLFDIKQLTQADLFDSELDSSEELNKKGFARGAGAIAGVVLEKHLGQVCENHNIKIAKKHPSISDFNDTLKNNNVYDIPVWRKVQHLGDLRNLCDHDKKKEPTKENISELIDGVNAIIKSVF